MNTRGLAANVVRLVLDGQSLTDALQKYLNIHQDYALLQAISYGVIRHYQQLDFIANKLLHKPFKRKDQDLHALLLVGLYQLIYMRIPDYAAISETVNAAKDLKKIWAKHSINACLRHFKRKQQALIDAANNNPVSRYSHPSWLIGKIKQSWPEHWQTILEKNNQQAPLCLRINQQKISRDDYADKLREQDLAFTIPDFNKTAIILNTPKEVKTLPAFEEGFFSVQDAASQFVATLLAPKKNEHIVDACAAPGGKTCHLLEIEPTIQLTALDQDSQRLQKVSDNLQRLQLNATVKCCDALAIENWWDENLLDAILLDAPCSATGVIRRHPDIKLLRRYDDIAQLANIQQQLLRTLWPLLKKGGRLLYSTCSIFADENEQQIEAFIAHQNDVEINPIKLPVGRPQKYGWQILPGDNNLDGFYYCLLQKI